jgi:hypothetical protein
MLNKQRINVISYVNCRYIRERRNGRVVWKEGEVKREANLKREM